MRVKAAMMAAGALAFFALFAGADPGPKVYNNVKTANHAFGPGEKLTYSISWSKVLEAGIAEMEVREGRTPDGKRAYNLLSRTHSVGMVDKFYTVRDTVESIVDAADLCSVAFRLRVNRGSRKRERDMLFDRAGSSVKVTVNGASQSYPVPERVQDALSSLYYIRTRQDLIVGKSIIVDVHDSGKTWAVEVQTLGKERITTPAGEFDTLMVKTFPKYEGVFMNRGEIAIWFTDDARRVPVLMKSKISIGSIVATLIEKQDGAIKP